MLSTAIPGVNGKPPAEGLLLESLQPIDHSQLSDFDKGKIRALITGFHLSQIHVKFPPVLEVEIQRDWAIPGTDWIFHFRLDLVVDHPDYGVQVWDWKTTQVSRKQIECDREYSWWLAKKQELGQHDLQVNAYAKAAEVDTVCLFQLAKPPFRPLKADTPETFYQRCLSWYLQHPSRAFSPVLIVPTSLSEVEWELYDIAQRAEYLKSPDRKHTSAIKNRQECNGCPFFPVCTGALDIEDDRYFATKEQAVEGGKYLSVSQIHQFHQCERKWFHTYCEWREPKAARPIYFEFGGTVHNCLEIWAKGINKAQEAMA